jgi:hypothetical protein
MDRTNDDISRRAYELFLARGGEHGRDLDDWLEAERQLKNDGVPLRATRRTATAARAAKPTARQKTR